MTIHHDAQPNAAHGELLHRLVEAKGLRNFAFFFVTGEGRYLPDGLEMTSGTVIDHSGKVFSFWTAWDEEKSVPMLARWREVQADPGWLEEPEYRKALQAVGLTR